MVLGVSLSANGGTFSLLTLTRLQEQSLELLAGILRCSESASSTEWEVTLDTIELGLCSQIEFH